MHISENSRIWIYQADRELQPLEQQTIRERLNAFTVSWEAHGNKLCALGEIRHNRFIILAIDEDQALASGCSIDKSVALIKNLEQEFSIRLLDRTKIAYRDGLEIKSCSKEEFKGLIEQGPVNEETMVFNNLIQTYGELETNWEVPLKKSWHKQVFAV